jgi:allantoin racemase
MKANAMARSSGTPAEACMHLATTVGERVSILVGRSKWIPEMHENAVKYGFADKIASFRLLRMTVNEFQQDPAWVGNESSSRVRASR